MSEPVSAVDGARWTWKERSLLGLILGVFILSTPGFGPETRPAPSGSFVAVGIGLLVLPPIIAFATSWKWPVFAAWFGVISGVALILMGALDLAGALVGQPPVGMKVVDALMIALGVVIAWRTWALLHPGTR